MSKCWLCLVRAAVKEHWICFVYSLFNVQVGSASGGNKILHVQKENNQFSLIYV